MNSLLNERLGEAFVNKTYRVLGLKLQPFSLWHLFLLTGGNSPFLEGRAIVNWAELRWAVAMCRSQYPNVNWPSGKELCLSLLKCPYPKLEQELLAFNTYILDHYSVPLLWSKDKGETSSGDVLAGIASIIVTLVGAGFDHEEVWNMSAGGAYWYFCFIQKSKGAEISFVAPNEIMAMQKVVLERAKNAIGKN